MFEGYDSLSFFNKYYYIKDNQLIIGDNFDSIIKKRNKDNYIDPTALVELVNKHYMLADRTLLQGIGRTPWMAKPNDDYTDWKRKTIDIHSNLISDEKRIADKLFELLKGEISVFCKDKETVGILLSGGMDSRIVAGVLYSLIKEKTLNVNVVAITWGIDNSRDVIYAERLAKHLKWEWIHIKLSEENLLENISITAKLGCEFSPIHLHAMPQVRKLQGIDCILAATFGDSIGRARYSGKHIKQLKTITKGIYNRFSIFNHELYKECLIEINQDVNRYHELYPQKSQIAKKELDLQYHYLRRQLNPCMSYINEKIPLYQAFSSPIVYEYMWSINPNLRNDKVYRYIIEKLDGLFLNIPWSKTGKEYMNESETGDSLSKEHNMYGKWIRNELHTIIKEKVLSDEIDSLNVFNMDSLQKMIKVNKEKSKILKATRIDEILIWLTALSKTIKMYSINGLVDYEITINNNSKIKSTFEIQTYIFLRNLIDKYK